MDGLHLGKIRTKRQLEAQGFAYTGKSNVPERFVVDGTSGDYGEYLYKHKTTGQIVTLVVSREFGIFDVYDGDRLGTLHYS